LWELWDGRREWAEMSLVYLINREPLALLVCVLIPTLDGMPWIDLHLPLRYRNPDFVYPLVRHIRISEVQIFSVKWQLIIRARCGQILIITDLEFVKYRLYQGAKAVTPWVGRYRIKANIAVG
jgi:hypothetical protein